MKYLITLLIATLSLNAFGQVPNYVPSDGLVAWYPFNGNANDESGNGNDGTVVGASATIDRYGNLNSALEFLGAPVPGTDRTEVAVDNHVAVPNFGEGFENGISISLWSEVYPTSESAFLQRRNNNNIDFSLELNNSQQPGVHLGFMALGSTSSTVNEWTHIALSYDEQTVQLFKNGMLIASEPSTQNINSYDDLLLIGKYIYYGGSTHHFFFNGKQDDIGIWNRALTEEEILALYNAEMSTTGCIDSLACNFDEEATEDDGSCVYTTYGQNCDGNCAGSTLWFVDAMADSLAEIGDSMAPFSTIQAAFDAACPSDTILIAPGTYIENVSLTAENITVRGYAPSLDLDSIASQVIIDGAELGTALYVSGTQTVLMDLTIQNGKSGYGAGLYMEGCNGSLVQRCIIRDNVGTGDITAHGIQLGASDCIIEDCLITGNYGRKHTVNAGGNNNIIRNCRITDNNAWETGGGIVVYTTNMLIENCLIANNNNGGVTTYKDDTVIDQCTITENSNFGCFIWCYSNDADFYITNSIIANNGSSEFKMVQTGDKVATAHLRNVLVEGGVEYEWISVYKQFDTDSSLITLPPDLQINFELASTSPAIAEASNLRFGFDGILSLASSVQDLEFGIRPAPAGSSADLGCFEHPLGVPEPTLGCMDIEACNYNIAATDEDGSCIMPTCDDPTACNFDENAACGGGLCVPSGCMEAEACNYNSEAECEDGTCDYSCCPGPGCCLDGQTWDWGQMGCVITNPTDSNLDGCTDLNDLMDLLSAYGDCAVVESEFTCGDLLGYQGYDYETVQIGEQCWFSENCRYLPEVSPSNVGSETEPYYYVYDYQGTNVVESKATENYETYGVLYNWPAVMTDEICPSAWHIPSDGEWQTMEVSLGMSESEAGDTGGRGTDEGYQMKSTLGWNNSGNGSNSSGFNGLPGGYRFLGGYFYGFGVAGVWWSPSEFDSSFWIRELSNDSSDVARNIQYRDYGFSARCIKD